MEFVWFLVVGLIAGIIAKAVMPGTSNEPSGWLLTILLGIVGAYVGGFIGRAIFGVEATNFIWQIVLAAVGAIVIIALLRLFTGRRAV
jgi:uncharacterized membrane protein YeaQ/YmgE (transglycosylase-associated protein family)